MKKACKNNRRQMEQLQEMLQDRMKKDGFDIYQALWLEQEILCYIVNYKKKEEEEFFSVFRAAPREQGGTAEKILFVVSRPFTDLTHIKEIYEKGVKPCLQQKFYFNDKVLIGEEEYSVVEIRRFHYEKYTELLKQKQYQPGSGYFSGIYQISGRE